MHSYACRLVRHFCITKHVIHRNSMKVFAGPGVVKCAHRQVSSSPVSANADRERTREWKFDNVHVYGKLVLRTGPFVNYHILPIDPQENPSQDKAFIKLVSSQNVDIHCAQEGKNITLYTNDQCREGEYAECEVKVPIKYSCDAVLGKNCAITLEALESDDIKVKLDSGLCRLRSIQCGNADISSENGEVVGEKSLLGSIIMETTSGNISLHKVVGPKLSLSVKSGNVHIKNLYSDQSEIVSKSGNVRIGSCHRDCNVAVENGNLKIDSIDGNLSAEVRSGNIDVHIDNHKTVSLSTEHGDISISLPESLASDVKLQGTHVSVDKTLVLDYSKTEETTYQQTIQGKLKGLEENSRRPYRLVQTKTLTASASNGSINMKCQDWFDSLNIPNLQG